MSALNSILNAVVLVGLCVAAYFIVTDMQQPVGPPDDLWFKSAVIDRTEPVLVKFGADWCPPCRMMERELDDLSGKLGPTASIVRINVDQHPALAQHYGVSSIPRLLLFNHGQIVGDRVGFVDEQQLREWIATNAGN